MQRARIDLNKRGERVGEMVANSPGYMQEIRKCKLLQFAAIAQFGLQSELQSVFGERCLFVGRFEAGVVMALT
jgi:hypothetical protein